MVLAYSCEIWLFIAASTMTFASTAMHITMAMMTKSTVMTVNFLPLLLSFGSMGSGV